MLFYLIYLRLDIIVIYNIWYLIAFELLYHLIICLYLYWYLPCYVQLLPGGVGFLPTPPREELVSFQLLPGGVCNIYNEYLLYFNILRNLLYSGICNCFFYLIYLRLDIIVIYNIGYLILTTLQLGARLLELGRATGARRVELCE